VSFSVKALWLLFERVAILKTGYEATEKKIKESGFFHSSLMIQMGKKRVSGEKCQ